VSPSESQQSTPTLTPSIERRATKEDQIDSTVTSFDSESPLERSMAAASLSESSCDTLLPSLSSDRPLRSVQSTTQLTNDAHPADAPEKVSSAVLKTRSGSILLQAAIAEALKKNRQSMNVQRGADEEQILKEKLESASKVKAKRQSKRESLTLPKIDFDALNKNSTISSPRRGQETEPPRSLPSLFNRRSLQMGGSDASKASPRSVSPLSM